MAKKKTSKGKRGKSKRGNAARQEHGTELLTPAGVSAKWYIEDVGPPKRIAEETDKSYRAFVCYACQPPSDRGVRATARILGQRSNTWVGIWSRKYQWTARVKKYDKAVERSKARAWHQHRAALELTQLERQRKLQEGAGDLLNEVSLDALREIITFRSEGEEGKPGPLLSRPSERTAAIQTLMKMAAHKPEPPLPPAPESGEGKHDLGAVFLGMRAFGSTNEEIRQYVADMTARRKALEDK